MAIYYATYHLHVKIKADDFDSAVKIASDTRKLINFEGPLLIEVLEDSLIVNLERVKEHSM